MISSVIEKDEMSLDDFRDVSGLVKRYGGIEYTVAMARRYIAACTADLQCFGPSPAREAMLELAEYVVTRNK